MVLLGDDAFSGCGHLALLLQANLHFAGACRSPVHCRFQSAARTGPSPQGRCRPAGRQARSRIVKTLGRAEGKASADDQLVEYFKPVEKPAWMSDQQWSELPEFIPSCGRFAAPSNATAFGPSR